MQRILTILSVLAASAGTAQAQLVEVRQTIFGMD